MTMASSWLMPLISIASPWETTGTPPIGWCMYIACRYALRADWSNYIVWAARPFVHNGCDRRGREPMSLVVTVYVPSGIVMAADSRTTVLRSEEREQEGGEKVKVQNQLVLSDNAYKVVALDSIGVGVSVYDPGVIAKHPLH